MITFQVDDVVPVDDAFPTVPLGGRFPDAMVVGCDPELPVLEPAGVHPLLSAVGWAFRFHRPLVLSPDAVWLTILRGVAQHVRLHAEELRSRLVAHQGKEVLVIVRERMPEGAGAWQSLADEFGKMVAAKAAGADLFECDFSTSTEVEKMAGRVVMLDAYSPYFAYWLSITCGIPSITLTGTVEDWQKIRERVDRLTAFGLDDWCRSLAPITDQFVRAASGDADRAFWQRIYNPVDAYGGHIITGWITRLYPYLRGQDGQERPNPLLELPVGEPRDVTVRGSEEYTGPGITSGDVPDTLSQVRINVNDRARGLNLAMSLNAGLVAVAEDDDGAYRPIAGWYLAPATVQMDDVIDRLEAEHEITPPQAESKWYGLEPIDITELYDRVGSATLFDGAWRIRPREACDRIPVGTGRHTIRALIDLPDGRIIGSYEQVDHWDLPKAHWVSCRVDRSGPDPRLADDPADIPVYGTSLAFLLDAAMDSPDDLRHVETGRLADLPD